MHAVVVHVDITDPDGARQALENEVLPMVSSAPGFVAAYWLAPEDGRGTSFVVFDSEEAATAMAERARTMTEAPAAVTEARVKEVIAHA